MDIKELIQLAKDEPRSFQIIGKGGRCLGLVFKSDPSLVLLLETGKDSSLMTAPNDKAHDRAVTFARQYDKHLSAGVESVTNNLGIPFVHAELVESVSPKDFGNPFYLRIGTQKIFAAQSARLVRRIPGKPLHYLDFVDPHSPLDKDKKRALAGDIALWMFTLHHQVSTGAMAANKVAKQFADTGRALASRALNAEKHRVMVTENVAEIQKLEARMADGSLNADFHQKLRTNMADAGVDFELLAATAKQLETHLIKVLPEDRIGLTHSDLHPANFIVNNAGDGLSGVCDWMTGTIGAQSMDFAGMGLARKMLPKIAREYRKLEQLNQVAKPINYEAVFAYAAMRQIFITVKAIKNGFGDGVAARVAWEQVGESVDVLARINPKFRTLARKHKHQKLPPIRLPTDRTQLGTHPSKASNLG